MTTITRTTTSTADELTRRLYDAEVALHVAHSSQVDAWIADASDRLHEAVQAHLTAVADKRR